MIPFKTFFSTRYTTQLAYATFTQISVSPRESLDTRRSSSTYTFSNHPLPTGGMGIENLSLNVSEAAVNRNFIVARDDSSTTASTLNTTSPSLNTTSFDSVFASSRSV